MPHHPMTTAEAGAILDSVPPHTGKLATVRADGRPHVAPIWFVTEPDGSILFTTAETSVKAANLRRAGRAALCVDDERPPFSYLLVEGRVELVDDLDQVKAAAGRIGGHYMGAARAGEFAARNGVPGELLVKLHPERMTGTTDVAD